MRIIGGHFRGARLHGPGKGGDIRPTPDRVREAVFNIIGDKIKGASLLDMFTGTGAVALEAVSRGAERVVAIERKYADIARKNMSKLGVEEGEILRIVKGDAFAELSRLRELGDKFDIIYADPPWKGGLEEKIVDSCEDIIAPGGWLILESYFKTAPPEPKTGKLAHKQTRRYGDTTLIFYEAL